MPQSTDKAALAWLTYYRSALADGDLMGLDAKRLTGAIPYTDFAAGTLPPDVTQKLIQAFPADADFGSLIFAPYRAAIQVTHGVASLAADRTVIPIWIPAVLARDGSLAPSKHLLPWIPRERLDPTSNPTTIGSLADYDAFLTDNLMDPGTMTWPVMLEYANKMLTAVLGHTIEPAAPLTLSGASFHVDDKARFAETSVLKGAGANILRLYDALQNQAASDKPLPALIRNILPSAATPTLTTLPLAQELIHALAHTGQMTARFSLSPSQRRTLHHFLATPEGQILAVNGPPGTGKTTLLQSVIASLIVNAALAGSDHPPVIVAASTNNQAVTNVIESFATTADAADPLTTRWLPDVNSFGLYCPSEAKLNRDPSLTHFQCCATARDGSILGFPAKIESPEYFSQAQTAFLEHLTAFCQNQNRSLPTTLTLKTAKATLASALADEHALLTEKLSDLSHLVLQSEYLANELLPYREQLYDRALQADVISAELAAEVVEAKNAHELAETLARDFKRHHLTEPFLLTLFAFLPPVRNRIALRNLDFFTAHGVTNPPLPDKLHTTREIAAVLDAAVPEKAAEFQAREHSWRDFDEKISGLAQNLLDADAEINRIIGEIIAVDPQPTPSPLTPETSPRISSAAAYAFLDTLDTTHRARLWWLAVHYFEACWLLERDADIQSGYRESQAPNKQIRRWQRYAKLTPCIVTTLHMAPRVFSGYAGKAMPLYESIDLLILDESGQISPEVAIPTFSLAKKALIVGDTFQIEPVWSVPESVDAANLIAAGHLPHEIGGIRVCDIPEESGLRIFAASSGSLMRLAQQATSFSIPGFDTAGMHLTEHRRCQTPIISYCQALAYPHLEPLTPPTDAPLPPFGYAHIAGESEKVSGSRLNLAEATTIASWLASRAEELCAHYKRPLGEIVAVVTPFSGQAGTIRAALADKGLEGLTVGTVHCLQGAERPVILFSPTVTSADPGPYFFDRGPNMLNVAVSRAKDSFLVFGDMHCFNPKVPSRPSGLLADFLFNRFRNEIVDIDPPRRRFRVQTETRTLTCLEEHVAELTNAFLTAREEIIIVSPFLTGVALAADDILEKLTKAILRQVQVQVFTDRDFNKDRLPVYFAAISALRAAGATVTECDRIHCKTLMVDNVTLVEGSFNWLSARRDHWARQERSMVYTANNLSDIKTKLLESLNAMQIAS